MEPNETCLTQAASGQAGYFTTTQARSCGYSWALLSHHSATGRFVRVRRGLYRMRAFPSSPYEEVMAAWLAAGPGAVVSHDSALDLLGVGDTIPDHIHITVPRSRRGSRLPQSVAVHTSEEALAAPDIVVRSGMRVTGPVKTIIDVTRAGLGPDHVSKAIRQTINRGIATEDELRAAANLQGGRVWRVVRDALADLSE